MTSAQQTSPETTTLYRNGRVYSPSSPWATAFLVEDGRIAWIGSEDAAAGFTAERTVDLADALVTPAFVDAHVHATSTGLNLTGLDLSASHTLVSVLDAVAAHAALRPGAPLLGHGWDQTGWPEGRPPTAAELDRAADGAQVYLSRIDKHSAVVSSALMAAAPELAGLAGYRADGLLTIDAHHAVRALALGTVPAAERTAAQRATLARAAAAGIGAVHECGGPQIAGEDDFAGLLVLAAAEPGPEVYGYWGELMGAARAVELGATGAGGDLFADGALGSRTACLHVPYADADGITGHSYLDAEQIAAHLVDCAAHGVQGGFHAIGDAALSAVLDGFAKAAAQVGVERFRAGRHRIEHAEMLDTALIRRMVEFGAVASVQPAFDAYWGGETGMYAERLGVERALTLNPFGPLAGVGVPLAFGSDSPVTPLDPWATVRAAAHHRNPHHAISVRAGFAAHTRGGWRAVGRDDEGVLAPGAPATFAVWAADEVVVQVPDERVSRWSTDPRGAVPGLPDLSPGAPLPTCLRTVVRGHTIFNVEGTP
jgi:predicted amidohydrolase YtcJ